MSVSELSNCAICLSVSPLSDRHCLETVIDNRPPTPSGRCPRQGARASTRQGLRSSTRQGMRSAHINSARGARTNWARGARINSARGARINSARSARINSARGARINSGRVHFHFSCVGLCLPTGPSALQLLFCKCPMSRNMPALQDLHAAR